MSRERIPLTFEIEIGVDIPTKEQQDRFVTPWRANVLISGVPTGAYAVVESSGVYGPPDRYLKEHLVEHATRSFIARLNKALTIAKED